jgi:hypothetical protein
VLIVVKSRSLNHLEPSGPVKACNEIALALPYRYSLYFTVIPSTSRFSNGLFRSSIRTKTLPRVSPPLARVTGHTVRCATQSTIRLHDQTQPSSASSIRWCPVCIELRHKSTWRPTPSPRCCVSSRHQSAASPIISFPPSSRPQSKPNTRLFQPLYLTFLYLLNQWRTQEFFSGGAQQIQLRTEGRENGDLGAVAP